MGRVKFTAGRVDGFECPKGKAQAFLWDSGVPGLALRVTAGGSRAYIYQSRFQGATVRVTIGSPDSWRIGGAQERAREIQQMIDRGRDPRAVKAEVAAADVAARQVAAQATATVGEAWAIYLAERKDRWGDLHYRDHLKLARAGGVPAKRGTDGRGVTIAMPLHPLMSLKLRDLDSSAVEAWAAKEAKTRPTSARLAWRLLKVFLNWCAEKKEYAGILPERNAAATNKTRETLGKAQVKKDALLKEQLPAWFKAVRGIANQQIAAALQVMLLTGARPGEVLTIQWSDVDVQWRRLTIRDKVEGAREIPLTPYVQHLLEGLPRRNGMVFSSATAESGALTAPRKHHVAACMQAGINGLTLHGLRRSFKSLTEWLEIPAGVVAQTMGHKPSATAEKHYTVRPLDLLRVHHERIEAWMLQQAGVAFKKPDEEPVTGLAQPDAVDAVACT
ncbi:MAG: DUF4102 domain-containing protein [Comamonadaceae bacterium]|nr:MAG: DUF4102 domain-containing protein [Comamonadaceae bacterium]